MTDSDMIVANQYRTHSCNGLSAQEINESVNLSGWVHRIRDHGGLLFVDLRDHYGITQCVVDPDSDAFAAAESLRPECCIKISGEVRARDQEAINDQLATGKIEVFIRQLEILGPIEDLPLPVFGEPEYPEDTRLTYRFLDLRRETLHQNIILRSKIIAAIRSEMQNKAFNEFQTPILTASSPEGARDYLIASRVHPGQFYALPQAPQQFKQLLMIAGFDRYFQIAPCFRDEDPRADRLPGEFYQLDVEMSFVEQEDILAIMEEVVGQIFSQFAGDKAVPMPFQRISYKDALKKYASDKPDLRNPIQMSDASATFHNGGFKLFANMLANDDEAEIRAIPAPGGGSRAFCDRINSWAQSVGQPGLGYIFFRKSEGDEGATEAAGPIARNLGPERTELLRAQLGLKEGDAVFFCGGRARDFEPFAATARTKIASELQLIDPNSFALAWIIDFPMYEWNEEESRFDFSHNPFSMPKGGLEALTHTDPKFITAHQYDLVCNGYEIASGAIRNHRPEIMRRAFEIAGYGADDLQERFSGMYRALHYGAPPHGGMAAGIDRIVMLLAGAVNLREIMPFPMNQQARDLLMGAPSAAAPSQLRELHLRLIPTDKK